MKDIDNQERATERQTTLISGAAFFLCEAERERLTFVTVKRNVDDNVDLRYLFEKLPERINQ